MNLFLKNCTEQTKQDTICRISYNEKTSISQAKRIFYQTHGAQNSYANATRILNNANNSSTNSNKTTTPLNPTPTKSTINKENNKQEKSPTIKRTHTSNSLKLIQRNYEAKSPERTKPATITKSPTKKNKSPSNKACSPKKPRTPKEKPPKTKPQTSTMDNDGFTIPKSYESRITGLGKTVC